MEKYDASQSLKLIVEAIRKAQRLGLAVYVEEGKIAVVNTVAYAFDEQHGNNPKENAFAYAEFDGFSDPN